VIHNGIDADHFCDRSDREARRALRNELGFAESDYVIGILAVLRPEKNHVQLVDAAAALQARGIAARVLMIGDGEMRSTIEARALSLKGERNVAITGFQQDVRPYISACDVVVLCSVAVETFSLAALEAMAMGRPVIHSDIGGASEMIVPGRNGFLFPAGDTKALVDKLAVLSDRAVAERMGHEARAMVTARFSERMMVDRYEQTLLELCGAGRSDRAISRPTSALDKS
jgi:glycosyltransferase involved in cell wall biosynthesis